MEGLVCHYDYKQDCQKSTSSQSSQDGFIQYYPRKNKEKSQLCKKYVEYGYCPYEQKCKFAHGKHQLRCNNQTNSRYKTKHCVAFFKGGYCPYGQRCNFLHLDEESQFNDEIKWFKIKKNFREIIEQGRRCSRFFP